MLARTFEVDGFAWSCATPATLFRAQAPESGRPPGVSAIDITEALQAGCEEETRLAPSQMRRLAAARAQVEARR